jgi:Fur family zinc uptake transcriptional regulator
MASQHNPNLSKNASLVHAFLARHGSPVSAYEILDGLREKGISAPPTIYRALDQLVARGLAHRVESLNAFVACDHPAHDDANGFAICQDCGTVREFTDPEVVSAVNALAKAQDFDVRHVTIELAGHCSACRDRGASDQHA